MAIMEMVRTVSQNALLRSTSSASARTTDINLGSSTVEDSTLYELSVAHRNNEMALSSRLAKYAKETARRLRREKELVAQENGQALSGRHEADRGISPDGRVYTWWRNFVLLVAVYSAISTPFHFAFFTYKKLPLSAVVITLVSQLVFLVHMLVTFRVAFIDRATSDLVTDGYQIAIRYLSSWFVPDLFAVAPWELLYKVTGRKVFLFLVWFRLVRIRHLYSFFNRLSRDTRYNYLLVRVSEMLFTEIYFVHIAACIFYFLARSHSSNNNWLGTLVEGAESYADFITMSVYQCYCVSMYWGMVTMAGVGYGDVHPVSPVEMIFASTYIIVDMMFTAYLLGNFTALVVRTTSKSQRLHDTLFKVTCYANRMRLPESIRKLLVTHIKLQDSFLQEDERFLKTFPKSIRKSVLVHRYKAIIKATYLFHGCSERFLNRVASKVHLEHFTVNEVIVGEADVIEHIYFIVSGEVEWTTRAKDRRMILDEGSVFGESGALVDHVSPFTVRANCLTKVIRLEKDDLLEICAKCPDDYSRLFSNFVKSHAATEDETIHAGLGLGDKITELTEQREANLVMNAICVASTGDLQQLKSLADKGVDLSKGDYDKRTALHLAANRGYTHICAFLLDEGVDVNMKDNFGVTPLLECLREGHRTTAALLRKRGGEVLLTNPGRELNLAVQKGSMEYLQRLLEVGFDPNSGDHDKRTPLHVAAAESYFIIVRMLLEHGANPWVRDRSGHLPIEEAYRSGSRAVISLLAEAMRDGEHSTSPSGSSGLSLGSGPLKPGRISAGDPLMTQPQSKQSGCDKRNKISCVKAARAQQSDLRRRHSVPSVISAAAYSSGTSKQSVQDMGFVEEAGFQVLGEEALLTALEPHMITTLEHPSPSSRPRVTMFGWHPWTKPPKDVHGTVLLVPETISALCDAASEKLSLPVNAILNEDGGIIEDIQLIRDGDCLFAVNGSTRVPDLDEAFLCKHCQRSFC